MTRILRPNDMKIGNLRVFLSLILFVFIFSNVQAQVINCDDAAPFCGSAAYSFPNSTSMTAPSGPNYGKVCQQPSPMWYYMQIDNPGNIAMTISQQDNNNNPVDVDFVMWGPFSSPSSGCQTVMNGVAPIQSSFHAQATETAGIGVTGGNNATYSNVCTSGNPGQTTPPPAQGGDYYIVLVTNFDNTAGTVTFNQTNAGQPGSGSTNCDITVPCDVSNLTATAVCSGGTATISGSVLAQTGLNSGTFEVGSSCGGSQVFDIATDIPNNSAVLNYSFSVPGNGQSCTVTAEFTTNELCSDVITITVPNCCSEPTPIISTTAATCSTAGSASISNYNSGANYVFTPAGPSVGSGGVITGAISGTSYTVKATVGACESSPSTSFQINAATPIPDPVINVGASSCTADGTTSVTNISAYTSGFTYTFTAATPPNPTGATINGTNGNISGLTPGLQYTLTITDGGCTTNAVNVQVAPKKPTPAKPIVTTTAGSCSASGSASITNYDNTYTYTFSPTGPTVSAGTISGAAGTYTVTATNTDGCTSVASSSFTIDAQQTTPATPTVSTTVASCSAAGTASITNYNSSATYNFTPTGPTVNGTGVITNFNEDVTYTISATIGSCTSNTATFIVNSQPGLTATPQITTTAASCTAPGSSTITNYVASNTYAFTPAGPSVGTGGIITGATPGTQYSVTSTGTAGCPSSAITFTNPTQLASITDPVVSTVAAGCTTLGTASVTNYSTANTYSVSPSGSVGAGGAISGVTAGTYQVTATQNGCSSNPVSFTIAPAMGTPTTPTVTTTSASCSFDGASSVSNYDATMTYNFSPSGPFVSTTGGINGAALGTTYTVTVTDVNGCTSSPSSGFINEPKLPTPPTPTVDVTAESCMSPGTGVITNYDNTLTYHFNPNGPSVGPTGEITNFNPGSSYVVTATNTSGCTSTASASFVMNPQLTVPNLTASSISGQNAYSCFPSTGNYSISNIPGATYTWNYTGDATIIASGNTVTLDAITSGGVLTVIATNSCGNSVPQTLTISVVPMSVDGSSVAVLCGTGALGSATATPIGGNAPFQYQWSNGGTTETIDNLSPGIYSVLIIDATGCSATDTILVNQITNSTIDIDPSPATVLEGNSINLNATFSPYIPGSTYTWSPSSSLSCSDCPNPIALPMDSTTYYLTITTPEGCIITDSVDVNVKINCGDDYIPNIFSPNDDGENDRFIVQGRCIAKMSMKIFNRWGNLVFETDDLLEGWDGTTKGKLANTDVYQYVITVTWFDETVNKYKGTVTLVR